MVAVLEDLHGKALLGDHVAQSKFRRVISSEATFREPIFVAPFDCELRQVAIVASTAVAGAATNFVALNLINGGPEGAGTAELANQDYDNTLNLVLGKSILFSGITLATEIFLDQGDILELEAEENGTGDATDMPEILLYIVYRAANLLA